jgi:hypothetical protein
MEYVPQSSRSGWKAFWHREEAIDGGIKMRVPINDDRLNGPEMLCEEYPKYYLLASKEMTVLLTALAALEKAYPGLKSRAFLRINVLTTRGGQADDMFQSIDRYEELLLHMERPIPIFYQDSIVRDSTPHSQIR